MPLLIWEDATAYLVGVVIIRYKANLSSTGTGLPTGTELGNTRNNLPLHQFAEVGITDWHHQEELLLPPSLHGALLHDLLESKHLVCNDLDISN